MRPIEGERPVLRELEDALRALPGAEVDIEHEKPSTRAIGLPGAVAPFSDAILRLKAGGETIVVEVQVRKDLFPIKAQQLIHDTRACESSWTDPKRIFLAASRSISPAAKAKLEAASIGYFDASNGSLFLPGPRLYVKIQNPPRRTSRQAGSPFKGRRAQVVLAMLQDPDAWYGVNELARQAEVSVGTVTDVLTELEQRDWVETRGRGPNTQRQVRNPGDLLDGWVQELTTATPPKWQRYFLAWHRPDGVPIKQRIDRAFSSGNIPYAVTHELAAEEYGHQTSRLTDIRVRVLSMPDVASVLEKMGAQPVNEGANFLVLETESPGDLLFKRYMSHMDGDKEGIWCASPIQVYLDLIQSEGRAPDLAEQLRAGVILF